MANEPVQSDEFETVRMLEIAKPAFQDRIESVNYRLQARPVGAAGLVPQRVLQGFQAFLAPPASARFEAITQKVEALPRFPTVPCTGFVRRQGEAVSFYPGENFRQGLARFFPRSARNNEAVGFQRSRPFMTS